MVIAYQFKWCDTPLAPFIEDLTTSSLQFVCQFPTKFYHTNTWYKSTANFFPHWSSCFFSKSISCLLYITRHPFWHNSYPTYLMYIWRRVKGAINTGNSAFLSEKIRHGNGWYACCSNFLMLVFISTKFNHYSTRLWDFRKEEAPNQHSLGTTELYKAQNENSWILWLWQ